MLPNTSQLNINQEFLLPLTLLSLTLQIKYDLLSPKNAQIPHQRDLTHFQTLFSFQNLSQMYSPANIPLVLDIQGVELSPYFTVNGNAQIQFLDFTLQIPQNVRNLLTQDEEEQSFENMNIIQEQSIQESEEISDQSEEELNYESSQQYESLEYLSELPSSKLNLHYLKNSLADFRRKKTPQIQIKQFLSDYLIPENHQNVNIETASLNSVIKMAQHNLRPFGPITWLQRRSKVLKFKGKKSRRSWNKKINYDCRKKVADSRLRVKGKFVTKEQACNILGVDQVSEQNIKQLLELKFQNSK